ncbi:hypothetical protein ABH930_004549 [Kitasatospora sp. GAS204A]|nr:hypothetical protein [Kitasatospora sp. GAS204B]
MVHDLFRAAARHTTVQESAHLSRLYHQHERRWLILPGADQPEPPASEPKDEGTASTASESEDEGTPSTPPALILVPAPPLAPGHTRVNRLARILQRRKDTDTPAPAPGSDT